MWHPRRSERPSPASLFLTCNPTTATLSLPCCSLPAPWKHPTSLELQHSAGGSFCLLSSPAPGTEQVLKTVFEWRNEFLRNPQLSDIKVSANWILFSSKDFAAAECFHTFVKGMKSTYEDLSLFSCLQTHCRQVQGFLAGARPQGTVPGGREGGCGWWMKWDSHRQRRRRHLNGERLARKCRPEKVQTPVFRETRENREGKNG